KAAPSLTSLALYSFESTCLGASGSEIPNFCVSVESPLRSVPMRKAALVLALSGCAHASSDAAMGDLQAKLTDAQRKEADARRRIDELENRVFLMTDQLESHKVASAARAPRLPVVTLHPTEQPRRDDGDEVEFTGEAATPDAHHVRPIVLRGTGESG